MSDAEIGYADAMAELESILDDLEDDDLDVDVLASRVERASALITLCRDRIGAARVQVEKVVASLDTTAAVPEPGDDDITLDLDGG
jgi:exodeoxyribonuclease VII small subunit